MPDPTATISTLVQGQFSTLQNTLTGTLVPALFGLAIIGVVIVLALKYTRKGAKQA